MPKDALQKIVLTENRESIRAYPGVTDADVELSLCIGIHNVCNGWVDISKVSESHQAIVCRKCYLRVVVPFWVKNYSDLYRWSVMQEYQRGGINEGAQKT